MDLFNPPSPPPRPLNTDHHYTVEMYNKIQELCSQGLSQPQIAEKLGLKKPQIHYYLYNFAKRHGLKVGAGKSPGRPRGPAKKPKPMIPKVFDTDRLLQPDIETPAPRRSGNTEKVYMVPVPQSKLALVAEVLWQS